MINVIADRYLNFVGGSADLMGPNKTAIKHDDGTYSYENQKGRTIEFGIREFGMSAVCAGINLHGGLRPFCATFFVFSDYLRPNLRIQALMGLNTIYVLTHDSIYVGEDGPTHQPIETLASLRAIPNVHVLRPGDPVLPGFVITIVVIAVLSHKSLTTWDNFILQSTLLINFHPDSATIIKPGPFWYFGFVMQLYLFYRLLIYRRHWGWIVASIVSCWFVQVIQQPDGPLLEWLRYNFVMGILPLSMGVLCGRQVKDMTFSALIWLLIAVVSFCAVIVCNLHFQPWLWTHVFVIISSVAFIKGLSPIAQRPFQWLGAISSCLFVMHPLARAYTLYPAQNGHVYRWLLAYIVLSMLLAWLYQRLMHYLTPIITKHEESI